ncbi:hypothetical protein LTV02_16715 [Nocardia yamanashiensis]|uniref:hypothetical protein n=1 Tax=Nocardia yamanashiensis TaxID=209247 RepID=UPI001E5AF4A3|nr:hypothetical protein [Nocardia yamanashiensis]UGT44937.1 hypothetical protein LTV02_16715 [Nocardia yamanashiensis]
MPPYHGSSEATLEKRPREPIILDDLDAPGLLLLLVGVITLAWTLTANDPDLSAATIAGATVTACALVSGAIWVTLEHTRSRTHEDPCQATKERTRTSP